MEKEEGVMLFYGQSYVIGKNKAHLFLQAGDVREMLCDLGTK